MENKLPRGGRRVLGKLLSRFPIDPLPPLGAKPPLDVSLLEDRTLFSGTPVLLDPLLVDAAEDGPNQVLKLRDHFSLDDQGAGLQYSVVSNDNPTEFVVLDDGCDGVAVPGGGSCTLTIRFTPSTFKA